MEFHDAMYKPWYVNGNIVELAVNMTDESYEIGAKVAKEKGLPPVDKMSEDMWYVLWLVFEVTQDEVRYTGAKVEYIDDETGANDEFEIPYELPGIVEEMTQALDELDESFQHIMLDN